MKLVPFLFVAGGAVLLAVSDVFNKRRINDQSMGWRARTNALGTFNVLFAAILMLAWGMLNGGPQIKPGLWVPLVVTGMINIIITHANLKARALEKDLSVVSPISSTPPAIVVVVAAVFLDERPSLLGWAGVWVMVLGTYTLNIQDVREALEMKAEAGQSEFSRRVFIYTAPFRALVKSGGVRYAMLAALLSAITLNFDGLVARNANPAFGFGLVCLIIAAGNGALALTQGQFKGVTASSVRGSVVYGLIYGGAIICFGLAYQGAFVAYVGTLKRLSIPSVIILAYFFLGEKKSFKDRLAGGLLMAAGSIAITQS